jgi:hypothetical protein
VQDAIPVCGGPSAAELALDVVAMIALASSGARQPITAVVVKRDGASALLLADAFQLRPEVIARRIRRFRDEGAAGLRASADEIEAHRARFTGERDLSAGWLREASVLRLSAAGIRAGRRESSAKLHPWEDVVAAHVLPTVHLLPDVVEVELVDGRAIHVRPRAGMSRVDLAKLLAPRWVDEAGAVHRAST